MRIALLAAVKILLLGLTGSALAQRLPPPHAPYIPSTVTSDSKIGITVEGPDGRDILLPLALAASKQEQGPGLPESRASAATASLPSWTFVPFLDASNQLVFSAKAVRDWTTDQP